MTSIDEPQYYGCIEGTKYDDHNGNGQYDEGECGIRCWTIELYRCGEDRPYACTTTDEYGNYCFKNVAPGEYIIKEVQQDGWTTVSGTERCVTVECGKTTGSTSSEDSSTDFFNFRPGCIEGTKYLDKNADGHYNEGEFGLKCWTIELYKCGEKVACTTTDEYGNYKFSNLVPGDYTIKEVQQDGWQTNSGTERCVTVEAGKVTGSTSPEDCSTDFFNYQPGCIEGTKYYDVNRDGERSECDYGISGWKVYLYEAKDGKACGEPIACTTTNEYGAYKFSNVIPGCYVVVEEQRQNWDSNAPTSREVKIESGQVYGDDSEEVTDFFNYKLKACIDVEKYVSVNGGKTWYDADCKTGPVADACDKIQYKIVVKNCGEVDLCNVKVTDAKLDLNGSAAGTALDISKLCVGQSREIVVSTKWAYGQQENIAKASGVAYYGGEDYKTVCDEDAAYYWGIKGTFDANYWKSKIGQLAWDGNSNPNKYCLPTKDLLQDTNCDKKVDGLRIGDLNFNGKQDKGECTIVYSKAVALSKLCATGAGNPQIEKQLVAAWLNMLNGNAYNNGDCKLDKNEPGYWIDQAIKYLKGCGSTTTMKAMAYSKGIDTDKNGSCTDSCDVQSGAKILQVLTQYNKDGSVGFTDCHKPEYHSGGMDEVPALQQHALA